MDRGAVQQLEEQLGRDGLGALVGAFLEGAPQRLARLQDAAAAGNAEGVREEAHSLKGAARSFGAAEMGELSALLEQGAASGSTEQAEELVAALAASLERTRAELTEQLETPAGDAHERRVRVLLADDDPAVRGLLTALLDTDPALEVVGSAQDADEAITLATTAQPDVALLDLDMPGGGGWRAIEEIRARCPETQSIVLTALDTPEDQLHTMRSGAVDFLSKSASKADIMDAIRSAVRWRTAHPPQPVELSPEARIAELERRVASLEQSLLGLLARGT